MKKLYYRIFKSKVYFRLTSIKKKQAKRMENLLEVKRQLNKWYDIPITWQLEGLCKILEIRANKPAYDFLIDLSMPNVDLEKEAKKIPLG